MTTKEYFDYIVEQIHSTVVATVDEDGLPVTCVIDMMITPEDYVQKTVTLLSVTWGMTDAFLNDYFTDREKAGLVKRTKRISEESARCHKLLNDFISNNLGVSNLSFDVKKYNDIIGLVSEFPEYEKLRNQYFL